MAIGPVQLIALGFTNPDFRGEILGELEKLRGNDTVRVIDSLAVYKDTHGEIEVMHLSNLTREEAAAVGSIVAELIGLEIDGDEGFGGRATNGAQARLDDTKDLSDNDAWDVLQDIPNDSAVGLLLIEHKWAVPLRDAISRAGGFRLADGFIAPADLVAIGLLAQEEASSLEKMEQARAG